MQHGSFSARYHFKTTVVRMLLAAQQHANRFLYIDPCTFVEKTEEVNQRRLVWKDMVSKDSLLIWSRFHDFMTHIWANEDVWSFSWSRILLGWLRCVYFIFLSKKEFQLEWKFGLFCVSRRQQRKVWLCATRSRCFHTCTPERTRRRCHLGDRVSGSNCHSPLGGLTVFAPAAERCSWRSHRWTAPDQPGLQRCVSESTCGRPPSSPGEPRGRTAAFPRSNSTRATRTPAPTARTRSGRGQEPRPARPPAVWRPSRSGLLRGRKHDTQPRWEINRTDLRNQEEELLATFRSDERHPCIHVNHWLVMRLVILNWSRSCNRRYLLLFASRWSYIHYYYCLNDGSRSFVMKGNFNNLYSRT